MAEKDIPLDHMDAPPSYSSANMTAVPYTMPNSSPAAAATTMTIVQGTELQPGVTHNDRSQYSCGNPLIEVAERIARIVFILVLITFAGLAIVAATRVIDTNTDSIYYNDDDDDYYEEEDTPYVFPFLIFLVLLASLCCTVGSLLCDIPTLIAHFVTNKVMNNVTFRNLDIGKWTALSILYVIVFILIEAFVQGANNIKAGPVITAYLVFCGITIAMGILMAIWGCVHSFVNNNSMTSSHVVTIVPANSTQVV